MKRIATLTASLVLLLLPASALAQSSTCQSYDTQLCTVGSNNTSRTTTPASATNADNSTLASSSSTLPFTGLDVVLLAAGGGALLGAGLVVRRLSAGTTK